MRLRLDWPALEHTGEEFARSGHLYQSDLQILGERSLFSLLCTTRSQAGAERLAEYLLDAAPLDEARARQQAVRELRGSTALREQIALLGKYQFQGCDAETFREWMKTPVLQAPLAIPIFLFFSGFVVLITAVACLAQILSWVHALPYVLALAAIQALAGAPLFHGIRLRLRLLRGVASECRCCDKGSNSLRNRFSVPRT